MKKIEIYDTTLRDGAQAQGISFSVEDKLSIIKMLDELGVQYIEGGFPGSNDKDRAFFKRARKELACFDKICSFGSTRKPNRKPDADALLDALLKTETKTCTIFGKSWDLHVDKVLKVSLDENLKMISDSVGYLKKHGRKVVYDAEHFFDGYKANPKYAIATVKVAYEAGCDVVVLCDTNGGSLPTFVTEMIELLKDINIRLGVHMHNDAGLAVANSLTGVMAGAFHVHGTINGIGERCGNADLVSVIPTLELKLGLECIGKERLNKLAHVSWAISEICNLKPQDNHPYVGSSAFAHKGGVHVDAVLKDVKTYEHIDPELVGNFRTLLISEYSGRSAIMEKIRHFDPNVKRDDKVVQVILDKLQKLEAGGYHFEAADGSLAVFIAQCLGMLDEAFKLEAYRVIVEHIPDTRSICEATVKVNVNGYSDYTVAEGDGPFNALDTALRKALKHSYPQITDIRLSDFKVRVIDEKEGTAAKVRVMVQFHDKKHSWWTMGVSENIIEACWLAVTDGISYKLGDLSKYIEKK